MAMKQTQTKCFEFSDQGLDFSAGSKNLFSDRFKKMLAHGYNEQTVSDVLISGNQVTLNYGGAHGYVADRVLKVESGPLASINSGEFWIDSTTASTVTFTLDSVPASVSGGFITKIAPLGWSLEYESGRVQLYKMKYLDERDLFIRLVFAPLSTVSKNIVTVCVGKTADLETGFITDPNSFTPGRDNTEIYAGFNWLFSTERNTTYDDYTYSQGYSVFGRAVVVGSKYHINIMCTSNASYGGRVFSILPFASMGWDALDYPAVFGWYSTMALTTVGGADQTGQLSGTASPTMSPVMIGAIPVTMSQGTVNNFIEAIDYQTKAASITEEIEGFSTVIAKPIQLYEFSSKQYIGEIAAGLYKISYPNGAGPSYSKTVLPQQIPEYKNGSLCYIHASWPTSNTTAALFFVTPVEEIKIV